MDDRPEHPAILADALFQEGVAVGGFGVEITAKGLFTVGGEDREIIMVIIFHNDRLVVGDHLGKKADEKQREENPQADIATAVGAKELQAAMG